MTSVAGLASADQTGAQNLLINLSGSLAEVRQSFFLNSSSDLAFQSWSEMTKAKDSPDGFPPGKIRNNHQREMSSFFKDDWKVTRSLTLNLGVRWDYYGVPWEDHGLFGSPANNGGNGTGVFGISGTSFDDLFQPGRVAGSPTTIELVGKKSPNPDKQIYNDDYNNFGPAIGLSWSVPWFGPDKTMLRAGYGISYTGGGNGIIYDYTVNGAPGANDDETFQSPTLLTLSNITLPTRGVPFGPVGFNDRTKGVEAFDSNFVSPYVQNWNLEIQRNVTNDLSFAVRYIGSKGTKLQGEVATNEVNIFENGILDAFNITRTGGNAPLFDSMLMGLTCTGSGYCEWLDADGIPGVPYQHLDQGVFSERRCRRVCRLPEQLGELYDDRGRRNRSQRGVAGEFHHRQSTIQHGKSRDHNSSGERNFHHEYFGFHVPLHAARSE